MFVFSNARSILELMLCNQNLTKLVYQTLLSSDCIATEVSRPSTANFRMFKILLLFINNYLNRLHVTTTTYKWTLITMCTLQASCRHAAGQAKIPPLVWNHTSQIEKCISIFFQRGELFFGYSYCENKTCSENSMARAFR